VPFHDALTAPDAIHPAAFVGTADPAGTASNLVAADKLWIDTSTTPPTLKKRNAGNTDWDVVGLTAIFFDAKGDLIVGTAADAVARLPVGANNTALVADSAQSGGMKWTADLILASLELTGGPLKLSGDITPAQLTADTNDWAPTGLATAAVIRASTDASRNLTGLTGGADGRLLYLANVGAQDLVLKDESASSAAANRFALTADLTLTPDMVVALLYDGTSSRWRLAGGSGGGGGGGSITVAETDGSPSVAGVTTIKVPPGSLTDNGSGVVTLGLSGPGFAGASVYHSANQAITTGTTTALAFNSERYDTDAFHDTSTNTSRLTVPTGKGGKYLVTANAQWENWSGDRANLTIRKNGSTGLAAEEWQKNDVNGNSMPMVVWVGELAAGDYVEAVVWQNSGSNKNVNAVADSSPTFTITKLDGAGIAAGALDVIEEQVLGADAADVTFSSIPAGYKNLRVAGIGRSTTAAGNAYLQVQLNGDTGSNYDWQRMQGSGTGSLIEQGLAEAQAKIGLLPAASNASADAFGSLDLVIPHYGGTTAHKVGTAQSIAKYDTGTHTQSLNDFGFHWRSTAAVTSLKLFASAGNLKAGTTYVLYGERSSPGGAAGTLTGAYADRPSAGVAGRLYLPSDGFSLQRDTGSAWAPWGPVFPLTAPPAAADLAWVNQGTATATDQAGAVVLNAPTNGAANLRVLKTAAPAAPYTVTALLLLWLYPNSNAQAGLCFRQSSDGKVAAVALLGNGALEVQKWTNATTFSALYTSFTGGAGYGLVVRPVWLRIADDNTNRVISSSHDGSTWTTLHSVGRTDFLTADEVGFFANADTAGGPAIATLLSWKQA
jgi:hypothetical protein